MKGGREKKALGGGIGGGAPPSADLLVCFPTRSRLALLPKPICSPVRHNHPHHHLKKINTRHRTSAAGPASPLVWAKAEVAEPTSPKVTCAGQIKVRPRSSSSGPGPPIATCSRNWQSVMEEIERLHTTRSSSSSKKTKHWAEALGFKKDIVNFLTCLGNLRFDFRCFGSFPDADVTSDEEEEEEEDESQEAGDQRNTVFSKWFMVLQENQHLYNEGSNSNSNCNSNNNKEAEDQEVPPRNALLLMRCRSAPAKRSSWLLERQPVVDDEGSVGEEEKEEIGRRDEEKEKMPEKKKRESLAIVMKHDADFHNISSEFSKENWVVDGFQDNFSRSRSWKR